MCWMMASRFALFHTLSSYRTVPTKVCNLMPILGFMCASPFLIPVPIISSHDAWKNELSSAVDLNATIKASLRWTRCVLHQQPGGKVESYAVSKMPGSWFQSDFPRAPHRLAVSTTTSLHSDDCSANGLSGRQANSLHWDQRSQPLPGHKKNSYSCTRLWPTWRPSQLWRYLAMSPSCVSRKRNAATPPSKTPACSQVSMYAMTKWKIRAGYPENPKTVSDMCNHGRRYWRSGACQKSYQSRGRVGAAFLQYNMSQVLPSDLLITQMEVT